MLNTDEAARLASGQNFDRLAQILAMPMMKRSAEQQTAVRRYYLDTVDKRRSRDWKAELSFDRTPGKRELEKSATVSCMVMADMPTPRDTFILKRGQYDQRGDKVSPGVPAAAAAVCPGDLPRNRLGLARWLVDPETSADGPRGGQSHVGHALRFWAGRDTGGFRPAGRLAQPSRAARLAGHGVHSQRGWDVKALHRLIVTSATYRQSARTTPLLLERDPKNRLLARSPRFRLPAETVRDNALAISGLLIERLGGPSVKPYQPAGLWEDVSVQRRYKYVADKGEGLYRRSMYTFWRRTIPPPAMLTFDAPDRETCVIRRARTNTPLQALILLNDPTYVEAARKLAEMMMKTAANAGGPSGPGFSACPRPSAASGGTTHLPGPVQGGAGDLPRGSQGGGPAAERGRFSA